MLFKVPGDGLPGRVAGSRPATGSGNDGRGCRLALWYSAFPAIEDYLEKTMTTLTAFIEFDPETRLYVGVVPGLPGVHSQAATLDELQENLREVTELVLEEDAGLRERLPRFIGVQQIEVA